MRSAFYRLQEPGSTTFKRDDLLRGFEPDSCFYIQNVVLVRSKRLINLPAYPPPDLVIEIDITSTSIDKLPIYAAMGVGEVWRHNGATLIIYCLEGDRYAEIGESKVLPRLGAGEVTRLINLSRSMTRPEWIQMVRKVISELI